MLRFPLLARCVSHAFKLSASAASLYLPGFVICTQADSINSTWVGGAEGQWSDAPNWTPSTAPQNTDVDGYLVSISSADVELSHDIDLLSLSINGVSLSGAYSLNSGMLSINGSNTISAGLTLIAAGPLSFGDSTSLTNHGAVQFNASGAYAYSASTATFTNASDGTLRFNPAYGTSIGGSGTSPFALVNHGSVLVENGASNALYAPVTQSATGLIRATGGSNVSLETGGTLAGILWADAGSTISLSGSRTYTLDQTAITGGGRVSISYANLTGSLASGTLDLDYAVFSGHFLNQASATLNWNDHTRFADSTASLTNHGTLQFNTTSGSISSSSTATLTNALGGTLRFNPGQATSVGDSFTSPFAFANSGTVLADNGFANSLFIPVSQSSSGLLRSIGSASTLSLRAGGTLAGTLQADFDANLSLSGSDKTYTLDQTAITGVGRVSVSYANLTGSLASGPLHLDDAVFSGAFTNQASATLHWNDYTRFADSAASLTNHGTLQFNITSGSISFPSTATLTNAYGGTLRFSAGQDTSVGDLFTSPFTLANAGTVLADNRLSNSLFIPVSQSASGLLRSSGSASTLSLRAGGTLAGTLQADPGAHISLSGLNKTYALDQTAITGPGRVSVYYANLTGSLASGTLDLDYAVFSGPFLNQASATLNWNDHTRFAESTASLTNHGTLQFNTTSGSISSPSTATLTNAHGGTLRFNFNASQDTSVGDFSTSPFSLANSGTVLADNRLSNSLFIPVSQSASGLLRSTGSDSTLSLRAGGTLAGTLQADFAAYLSLSGSDKTYALDQAAITGPGRVSVSYANLTGSLASGTLYLDDAVLSGPFTNQASATLHWNNDTRFADATASLTNHGTLQFNIALGSIASPSTATLTNAYGGTLRFNAGRDTSVGDSFTSPFTLANSGTVLADNRLSNSLFVPTTNTGLIRVGPGSSLLLARGFIQTAGEVRIEDANLSADFDQTLDFQGGLLRADGSISANLSLADTFLEIGAAQNAESLFVYGNVTLSTGITASFDLDGSVQGENYDFLSIHGNVILGGDLVVRLSSSFASTIQATDEFTLLVATSIGGTFTNVQSGQRISLSGGAGSFLVTITDNEFKLGGFSAVPEPSAYAALAGLGSIFAVLRRRRRA